LLRRVALCGVALFIARWFLYFAGRGIWAPISGDDLMNLHGYLLKTPRTLFLDNLRYWSTAYRPLGGLFYAGLYRLFGFTSLPFGWPVLRFWDSTWSCCFAFAACSLGRTKSLR
jgi:hypothetical protein